MKKGKHVEVTEGVDVYIEGLLESGESAGVERLRVETLTIPHSEMQTTLSQMRFVGGLLRAIGARRVLEVGTLQGYGAAAMAAEIPDDGIVVTLEKDIRYIDNLHERWKKAGLDKKIELRTAPAIDSLVLLQKETIDAQISADGENFLFDLIFIDADKGSYKTYVEEGMKLLRSRGIMLIDNILWGGSVATGPSDDNITRALQDLNRWIFATYGAHASIVPAWDGMIMIVKD